MGDLALIIFLVFVASVTTSVAPAVAGLSSPADGRFGKIAIALGFALVQTAVVLIGSLVGGLFMHLVGGMANYVVGGVLLFVAVKMGYDSMQVLKGKRLYTAMGYTVDSGAVIAQYLYGFVANDLCQPHGKMDACCFRSAGFCVGICLCQCQIYTQIVENNGVCAVLWRSVSCSGSCYLYVWWYYLKIRKN